MLSRFVITFLPRSKRFLVLWLQSPSAMILEPTEWLKGSQTSFGVWREDTGLLSRECMK